MSQVRSGGAGSPPALVAAIAGTSAPPAAAGAAPPRQSGFGCGPGPPPAEPDDAADGVIGVGQGEIETPGVQDHYPLQVTGGQSLYFDGIESPYPIKWNVYNEADEPLVSLNYDVGTDLEMITFPETGLYTIRIWGNDDGIGAYQFEIREQE